MIGGSPAASIIQVPTAWNSSLIVMGTRGRSTMADLMPGSTSQKVVSHAPCPVLIVR
jgi:nucleotide-binding universal stress UspA family protein